eukprot:scaffold1673_cov330-Pavlova_lutheri.AAC.1
MQARSLRSKLIYGGGRIFLIDNTCPETIFPARLGAFTCGQARGSVGVPSTSGRRVRLQTSACTSNKVRLTGAKGRFGSHLPNHNRERDETSPQKKNGSGCTDERKEAHSIGVMGVLRRIPVRGSKQAKRAWFSKVTRVTPHEFDVRGVEAARETHTTGKSIENHAERDQARAERTTRRHVTPPDSHAQKVAQGWTDYVQPHTHPDRKGIGRSSKGDVDRSKRKPGRRSRNDGNETVQRATPCPSDHPSHPVRVHENGRTLRLPFETNECGDQHARLRLRPFT